MDQWLVVKQMEVLGFAVGGSSLDPVRRTAIHSRSQDCLYPDGCRVCKSSTLQPLPPGRMTDGEDHRANEQAKKSETDQTANNA